MGCKVRVHVTFKHEKQSNFNQKAKAKETVTVQIANPDDQTENVT